MSSQNFPCKFWNPFTFSPFLHLSEELDTELSIPLPQKTPAESNYFPSNLSLLQDGRISSFSLSLYAMGLSTLTISLIPCRTLYSLSASLLCCISTSQPRPLISHATTCPLVELESSRMMQLERPHEVACPIPLLRKRTGCTPASLVSAC